jgi:hypothetical protein
MELDSDSEPNEPIEQPMPDSKEKSQQPAAEKPQEQPAASAKRRRRPNKVKKLDAEELANQFVRKINGGDIEDQE